MIALGLDTTGAWCTAALVNGAKVLASTSERLGRGHAERLAPMVKELLSEADIKPSEIDHIGICTGPGSFTGLRVALAFGKGFALPHKIPVVGLSALNVLAAQADPERKHRIVSVMDVRRGQLCWAGYDKGVEISAPQTQSVDDAISAIKAFGYDELVGDGGGFLDEDSAHKIVSGPVLAWLASERSPQTSPAMALYSRPPDAKLPGGKSLPVT